MAKITDPNEKDAYYLDSKSLRPQAAGVLWVALLERRLDRMFKAALRPDKAVHKDLFQPGGALSNFATKVRLAYLLGWFDSDVYKDLLQASRIRNRFAHEIDAKDFSDQRISGWLHNMHTYLHIPDLLAHRRDLMEKNPSGKNRGAVLVVQNMLKDDQDAFRFCVDLLLGYLEEREQHIREIIEKLDTNWLTKPPDREGRSPDGHASSS